MRQAWSVLKYQMRDERKPKRTASHLPSPIWKMQEMPFLQAISYRITNFLIEQGWHWWAYLPFDGSFGRTVNFTKIRFYIWISLKKKNYMQAKFMLLVLCLWIIPWLLCWWIYYSNVPRLNIVHSLIEACIYDCGYYGCDFSVDFKVKFFDK